MTDYRKLKDLLELERYPHRYLHKFIGAKTVEFRAGVEKLERAFPTAKVTFRETAGTNGTAYIAFTFEFKADSPDEIIRLLRATSLIPDIRVVL